MNDGAWLERHADRLVSQQARSLETSKLVATFFAGVTAALVGSSLEVGAPTTQEFWAVWCLIVSLVATLMVMLDRTIVADHDALLVQAQLLRWNAKQLEDEYLVAMFKAADFNEGVARRAKVMLAIGLVAAVVACSLALSSLLSGLDLGG